MMRQSAIDARERAIEASSTEVLLVQGVHRAGAAPVLSVVPGRDIFVRYNDRDLFFLFSNRNVVDPITLKAEIFGTEDGSLTFRETAIPADTALFAIGPFPIRHYGSIIHFIFDPGDYADLSKLYMAACRLEREL